METGADWQTFLADYEVAVRHFKRAAARLDSALAMRPPRLGYEELMAAEERAREIVLRARTRLLKHSGGCLDDTMPLRILNPDHLCDRNGPPERVIDATGGAPITGIFPTCSVCGVPQTLTAED